MPSIKDVLGVVSKKFGNDSLSKALESDDINSVEFTEDEFENISNTASSLLTPDAALNNAGLIEKYKDTVHPTIKKSIYDHFEGELREVAPKYGLSFDENDKAKDMLSKMKEHEFKTDSKDLEKYVSEIDNLNKQLSSIKENSFKEINSLKESYSKKELNGAIDKQLSKYELSEAYNKDVVKTGIYKTVKEKINDSYIPKVTDSGAIEFYQKDMPDKLAYTESNKPLTFNDFADPLMKDFVKKAQDNPKKVTFVDNRKENITEFVPNSMQAHLAKQRQDAFKMP